MDDRISRTAVRRIGRFSDGLERSPRTEASLRIGRFGDGSADPAPSPAFQPIGTFADGVARSPRAPASVRVGSFGDGDRGSRDAPPRRHARISTRRVRPTLRRGAHDGANSPRTHANEGAKTP
jgi:hypothetical protein